jgi:hypothetical protein
VLAAKGRWDMAPLHVISDVSDVTPILQTARHADGGLCASQHSCADLAQQQAYRWLRRKSRMDCSLACSMSRVRHHHVRHRAWFV